MDPVAQAVIEAQMHRESGVGHFEYLVMPALSEAQQRHMGIIAQRILSAIDPYVE